MTATEPVGAREAAAPAGGAPRGRLAAEELRRQAAVGAVTTVLVALPDLQGRLKGKIHDAAHLLEAPARGTDMCAYVLATDADMTPLDGFALTSWDDGYGDLVAVPDLATARTLPWRPRTALLHATALHGDGRPVEVAPRRMLQRQIERLAASGLTARAALETEFTLYRPAGNGPRPPAGRDDPAGRDGTGGPLPADPRRRLVPVTHHNLDYALDHPPRLERFLRRLRSAVTGAGLPLEALKTESAPGQVEITFRHGDPLRAADDHTVLKPAVRHVAGACGLAATFMAAPETGTGNGCHVHLSLWRDGAPLFAGPGGAHSDPVRHAVAGLLRLMPHLAPLWAPTPNSYRRFRPGSFAPTAFTWGEDNRTCAVRVTGHGRGRHLEVRLPGADANPYLALAAVLACVAAGLADAAEPPAPCAGDAYRDAGGARPLPATLAEALDAFLEPAGRDVFGAEVTAHYARHAAAELDHARHLVTDVERQRGFDRA
ncbi:glutamine synthetase family protein [Streptomyces capparidis]